MQINCVVDMERQPICTVGASLTQGLKPKILWFVSSLEQKGGGERFALEAVSCLALQGQNALLCTDRLGQEASFDGRYDLSRVLTTGAGSQRRKNYFSRAWQKVFGVFGIVSLIRKQQPDLIICQSEFDAVRLYLARLFCKFEYRVFVFGQMYQFKEEYTRYSSVFRPYLEKIIASRPGYRESVTMPPPKLSPFRWLTNEVIARLKLRALQGAQKVFTLSSQVQWECSLIYKVQAHVLRAAFHHDEIVKDRFSNPGAIAAVPIFLSVSRLVEKKRVELTIRAFAKIAATNPGRLRIIGTGPEEQRLKTLVSDFGLEMRVQFLGSVSDEELQKNLSEADYFISMDIGDFDISVCEALVQAKRVIVPTDFDVNPFGGSFTGLACVEPTVDALAQAMQNLNSMPVPSVANLPSLYQLTWEFLASEVVA